MTSAPVVEVYATKVGRCEGPVLLQAGPLMVCSISHGYVYEIVDGVTRAFADTAGGPGGLVEGSDGTLYVSQGGLYGLARQDPKIWGGVQIANRDGEVSWLSQDPYRPNDLCFGPDGFLYVTDPSRRPWDDGRLWRIDPRDGEPELLCSVPYYPNGIGFGIEDDALYVASTSHAEILRYPFSPDGRLGRAEVFARVPYGVPDGFAFDLDGNLIVGAVCLDAQPGELQIFDPDGQILDRLRPGTSGLYTNLVIDPAGTAYVTDTQDELVLRISDWLRPGLPLHPFR